MTTVSVHFAHMVLFSKNCLPATLAISNVMGYFHVLYCTSVSAFSSVFCSLTFSFSSSFLLHLSWFPFSALPFFMLPSFSFSQLYIPCFFTLPSPPLYLPRFFYFYYRVSLLLISFFRPCSSALSFSIFLFFSFSFSSSLCLYFYTSSLFHFLCCSLSFFRFGGLFSFTMPL